MMGPAGQNAELVDNATNQYASMLGGLVNRETFEIHAKENLYNTNYTNTSLKLGAMKSNYMLKSQTAVNLPTLDMI